MRTSWDLNTINRAITQVTDAPPCSTSAPDRIVAANGAVGAALIPINVSDRSLDLTFSDSIAELMDAYIRVG
jgi:hypothetical protein